jgi:hypothetical protein
MVVRPGCPRLRRSVRRHRHPDGPNATTRYPTAYFRTSFQLPDDPANILSLALAVNYDDGFVLWLNGIELARRDSPDR